MTFEDRVKAVAAFGVTERQARFLVTVLLHAGVCVPRQYARFAGIAYGQPTIPTVGLPDGSIQERAASPFAPVSR
jgi:hypothetical protein